MTEVSRPIVASENSSRAINMVNESVDTAPPVAFLGVCDGLHVEPNFGPSLTQLNVLRLRTEVVSCFFPFPLQGFQMLFAIHEPLSRRGELVCRSRHRRSSSDYRFTSSESLPMIRLHLIRCPKYLLIHIAHG